MFESHESFDAAAISWDDAFATLERLLPGIPEWIREPFRFQSSHIAMYAESRELAVPWQHFLEWRAYEYGFVDYEDSELLGFLFRHLPLPKGSVVFIPDDPATPDYPRRCPYRIETGGLKDFFDAYPHTIFDSSSDLILLFEDTGFITLFMHHGHFAHIDCKLQPTSSTI